MPHISVVTSLYKSGPYIDEFYRRSLDAIHSITDSYEFIFVDDGSPDDSGRKVRDLIEKDPNVRLVELSRNFGQHKAIMAGLAFASGDFVFVLDSDLEEEPELLTRYYNIMQEDLEHTDVVYGYMERRKGNLSERLPGMLFYKIMNMMADIPIPQNMLLARLMKRSYVENLVKFGESHVFLAGVMQLAGHNQKGVPTKKTSKGTTTYTVGRKLSLAADALISFTNKPLTFVAGMGLCISAVSVIVALVIVARLLLYNTAIDGWILVLASLWFLGGLNIACVGLVGFYVGRVFLQVKGRPNVVIKATHNMP